MVKEVTRYEAADGRVYDSMFQALRADLTYLLLTGGAINEASAKKFMVDITEGLSVDLGKAFTAYSHHMVQERRKNNLAETTEEGV